MSALVSCIIPTHNYGRFLAEALDSVFAQTWQPIEVIVVDDGSTDRTPEILDRYRGRLTVIRQEQRGPAAARNAGVADSRGAYLSFLDADDIWHPDKLRRQADLLDRRPDLAGCFTHARNFWVQELREEELALRNHAMARPQPSRGFCALMVRREVFDSVGRLQPEIRHGEDIDWISRAEDGGHRFGMIEEVMFLHRIHRDNLSRKTDSVRDDGIVTAYRNHLMRMRSTDSDNKASADKDSSQR